MLFTPPVPTLEAVRNPAASVAFAQVSGLGFFPFPDEARRSGQQATSSMLADVRTAPGWFAVRHSAIFWVQCKKSLGTELVALFETMVRAAPGWLSARPSQNFLSKQNEMLGTADCFVDQADVCTAPGWLSVRRLGYFVAGLKKSLGTELFSVFEAMVRASSGVLFARPSHRFFLGSTLELGTVKERISAMEACAASGWCAAQAPVLFSDSSAPSDYHLPVFPAECTEWMSPSKGKFIVDGTLGGGGHSEIFLKAGARVIGVDRDPEALAHASARLAEYGAMFSTWEGNFSRIPEIPEIQRGERADGLLMDLGVSSRQLDSAARGFSFMREGPLDMRMGPSSPRTAAEIVNEWPEADLVRILFEYGEESKARKIAGAIVRQRTVSPFLTTLDLANCVERAIGRQGRTHPATKTFQAVRMAVNEELESLSRALSLVPKILKPGGRLLIITFHSLEDRMVKRFLKHRSTQWLDEPGWPEPRPNPDCQFRLLAKKAVIPTSEEISMNPRARSAKLRVAELLDT